MMMITSTGDETDVDDGKNLRRLALGLKVPIVTTVAGARATAQARPARAATGAGAACQGNVLSRQGCSYADRSGCLNPGCFNAEGARLKTRQVCDVSVGVMRGRCRRVRHVRPHVHTCVCSACMC